MNAIQKNLLLSCAAVLLTLTACTSDDKQPQTQSYPIVQYMTLETNDVPLITEHSGRTTALLVSEVRPQVGGIILEQLFTEGAKVEKGRPLYQIDPALFIAEVETAKANERIARLTAQRYAQLVKSKAVSRQEYDTAVAAADQAKAALNTAEINLAYTKVAAPISGIVGKSFVTPGALVTPGQATPLALVQQSDYMYVDIPRSGTDLMRLRRAETDQSLTRVPVSGAKVTLILPDGTEYEEPGELLFADVTVEESTGSYLTRAKFPNPDGVLLQNLFVRVRIEEAVTTDAILVPQKAVTTTINGEYIARVLVPATKDQKGEPLPPDSGLYNIETRTITVTRAQDNQWVVAGGLDASDLLAVDGVGKLRPDQTHVKIELIAEQGESATAGAKQ